MTLALGGNCLPNVTMLLPEAGLCGGLGCDGFAHDCRVDARNPSVSRPRRNADEGALGQGRNFKRGSGFHPLRAFVDHRAAGTGEPVAVCRAPATTTRTPPRIPSPSSRTPSCCCRGIGSGPGRAEGVGLRRRRAVHPRRAGHGGGPAPVVYGGSKSWHHTPDLLALIPKVV